MSARPFHGLAAALSTAPGTGPFAQNDKLRDVTLIGLGRIEAPEDVILDRNDNLYAGSRHGDIIRFKAPDYQEMEVYAHIGGQPLGMAFDRDDNLYVCIGGMGLYRITPDRKVEKVTDETNRSLYSVNDDSRLRLADDLDIADDGRIFFSEATVRYEMHEWPVDGLEARGNGRIICYDPNTGTTRTVLRGLKFPNGICIASDGQSILFAETFGCTDQALLVRRPEDRQDRDRDRQPAGLSRQHQSRFGRKLLAGRWSACAAPRSIWPGACPASASGWASGFRSTSGCSPTSTPAA